MINWLAVYALLVEHCGANPDQREDFVRAMEGDCTEYRFIGSLGFGGKLYHSRYNRPPLRVSCYPEDENPARITSIERANAALGGLS